ncbi:Uncharacterised protein [Mycobacteroides abscessus subsp. abscessus]|nr:Uncharacterised protein [Mycobacteroides abscessus subsp. abscessus]
MMGCCRGALIASMSGRFVWGAPESPATTSAAPAGLKASSCAPANAPAACCVAILTSCYVAAVAIRGS